MFTVKKQNIEIAVGKYEHFLNLDFADCSEGEDSLEVGVLIGLDFYYSFVSCVAKKGTKRPVAIESCLGWMLSGPYNNLNETLTNMITTHALCAYCEQDATSLTQVMKNFWDVDSLGVNNELEFSNEFEQNLQFDGEHYVVKLPIKPHEYLPKNHKDSVNRLKSLTSKLQKNTSLFTEYDKAIKNYIKEGIAETVQTHGAPAEVYYLPHRAVVRENKDTTKVRIVFDASSKVRDEPFKSGTPSSFFNEFLFL